MEKFTTHSGVAVPLTRSNVDTDQIIPARYLKRVTRTGFEDGLFSNWRNNEPDFVLNNEAYKEGSVLFVSLTSALAPPANTRCGLCRTTGSGRYLAHGLLISSEATRAKRAF